MEVSGANPFLIMTSGGGDENITSPSQSTLNPFLMEDVGLFASGGGESEGGVDDTNIENPFFTSTNQQQQSMSNPFAFDAMDDYDDPQQPITTNLFGDQQQQEPSIFSTTQQITSGGDLMNDDVDLVGGCATILPTTTTTTITKQLPTPPLVKPNELNLQNTTLDNNKKPPPRPAPPPRPVPIGGGGGGSSGDSQNNSVGAPVSKDTQDLILSVTGTMDTQTTHLLDCIPRTRTPSPISMRDLHSPSPTPGGGGIGSTSSLLLNTTDDLVDVGGGQTNIEMDVNKIEQQQQQQFNLFDMDNDDFNINTTTSTMAPMTSHIQTTTTTTATTTITTTNQQEQSLLFDETNDDFMSTTITSTAPPSSTTVCDINQNQTQNNSSKQQQQQQQRPPPPRPIPPKPPLPKVIQTASTIISSSSSSSSNNNNNINNNNNNNAQQQPLPPPPVPPTRPLPPKPPVPQLIGIQQQGSTRPLPPKIPPSPSRDNNTITTTTTTTEILNEANILDTTTTSLEQDNSNTNPFSFQEDTKLVDTLTNAQSTTLINDDMVLTTTTTTTTSATTTKQLIDDNSMFEEASSEQMIAPLSSSNITSGGDAFNDLFDQQQATTTTTAGGFNDLFGGATINEPAEQLFDTRFEPTVAPPSVVPKQSILEKFQRQSEEFDAFAAKFESAKDNITTSGGGTTTGGSGDRFDPFGGGGGSNAFGDGGGGITITSNNDDAWGTSNTGGINDTSDIKSGFGADDEPFDAFLSLSEPPPAPQCTPARLTKLDSDSDDDKDFAVFIKPKNLNLSDNSGGVQTNIGGFVPTLAPPPKSPLQSSTTSDTSPRFNPFDQQQEFTGSIPESGGILPQDFIIESAHLERTDSQETPPTPLFDEDTSQPLEEFPRIHYKGEGWEMQLRQPNKKKITGQRFWKKIFLKLVYQGDNPVLQLYNAQNDKDPFQELPLQACYSVSEIGAQQYDQFGKIFTIKLQYVFYKERPGVRPGQVTKAERITNKLSQFAAYAIQGDYQGVKEFGSDLKKLGLPVEHAPQISQLFKIGSQTYEHMKEFSMTVEEALFRLTVHRDRALHYKMEEVQITAVDELYVEQNAEGGVDKQIARVRLFFLGFLSGMPDIELGVNDMRRQGKEVVGRHDIIPVVTEEWIRLENYEFHACVQQEEYQKSHIIRFKPPDACYIELMRFRIRPPKNRELPLQLKAVMCVTGNKVELRADVLVPGFASRKLGQVPCEDVMIRFPIPECWIYLFRVEKHFRYGSVKSAHRRTGKIKGIERFLGTVETLQESLIEVTSGQAKYEHQHRSIVWRCPRLPKEGQGAYTTHNLVCRMALTSYDQIPEQLSEYAYVEFTMPATQVSHTTVRSVSVQGSDSDEPPEKYVRYLARHEYRVGIEHTKGEGPNAYAAATIVRPVPVPVAETPSPVPPTVAESSESDSD